MNYDWRKAKLSDFMEIKHGYAFKGEYITSVPTEYIVLTPGNFKIGGGFNSSKFKYYEHDEFPSSYILNDNDLIVTMTDLSKDGDTLGYSAKVPASNGDIKYLHNQRIGLVKLKSEYISKDFLYWMMRTKNYHNYIVNTATGTTVKHTSPSRILDYEVYFPCNIDQQKKIVNILSSIEEKIELNKKINQTLELIAQAIFKSWFVDFDPVHAKANAQSEDEYDAIAKELGISREILDLFPSEFEESELGLIPKGWRPTKIENYIEILDSKRVPLSKNEREKRKGNIPYYGATSIMDYIDDFLFDEPLTLIGEDGSVVKEDGTPFTQYIWGKSWVNNHAHVLKAKKNLSTEGIYILFKDTNVSSYVTGAVQPKINQNNLKRIPILEPSNHLYGEFSKFIDPLFSMVRIRTDETLQLCKLRDYLLPKLLSGEIDVSNLNLEPEND
ncbi:TPA: restriction endonuclease subunit S [Legionella pneumophila subsp. pneumophila]|nr:restriction endonuclease subunit S [Legionella pneumophila subsp. pneumophila]HAU0936189.1 restriction endonuclease subunit S [Legionella pneumophila]HAT9489809.1 restriction endonuclease subunit S [Legionella pneumophila subsp. pneumophila]HBP6870335.1 restriction endonuclease subunit S [Legionella pneumophila]HDO7889201.1 restriction endonuclease subunit S [Legionella pneumophila]